MVTKVRSPLAGARAAREVRWPYQLPAMVDEQTDREVRELAERREEPLAATLRYLLAEGLATAKTDEAARLAEAKAARARRKGQRAHSAA